jgi:hypothetical protein
LATRASETLLARKEELALAVTDAVYAARPELRDRYGEIGITRCREDMRYTIEHLAPAVALGEPTLFGGYVTWLVELLRARSIPEDDVRLSLVSLCEILGERLPPDESAEAARIIAAALASSFSMEDTDA